MDWELLDRVFVGEVDDRLSEAYRRGSGHLACKPGCSTCCFGIFPINQLDARRLRRGMEELDVANPRKAEAIRRRAQEALQLMQHDFPGDPRSGILTEDEEAIDAFTARFSEVACPALDPASGFCGLYAVRPITCRTFGPPILIDGENLPPCTLCFTAASTKEIEYCRTEPDPDGLENAILWELRDSGIEDRETIIAYALLSSAENSDNDRTDNSRAD